MDIVAVKDSELERYVTKIMLEIGVPAHLKVITTYVMQLFCQEKIWKW